MHSMPTAALHRATSRAPATPRGCERVPAISHPRRRARGEAAPRSPARTPGRPQCALPAVGPQILPSHQLEACCDWDHDMSGSGSEAVNPVPTRAMTAPRGAWCQSRGAHKRRRVRPSIDRSAPGQRPAMCRIVVTNIARDGLTSQPPQPGLPAHFYPQAVVISSRLPLSVKDLVCWDHPRAAKERGGGQNRVAPLDICAPGRHPPPYHRPNRPLYSCA